MKKFFCRALLILSIFLNTLLGLTLIMLFVDPSIHASLTTYIVYSVGFVVVVGLFIGFKLWRMWNYKDKKTVELRATLKK